MNYMTGRTGMTRMGPNVARCVVWSRARRSHYLLLLVKMCVNLDFYKYHCLAFYYYH